MKLRTFNLSLAAIGVATSIYFGLTNPGGWIMLPIILLLAAPRIFDGGRASALDTAYEKVLGMRGISSEAKNYFFVWANAQGIRGVRFRLVTLRSRSPEHAQELQAVIDYLEPYTVKKHWWD